MEIKEIVIDYSPVRLNDDTKHKIDKVDKAKTEISKKRPFEGALLKQVKDFYRIDVVWSSEALEGNTLTISETKVLLEDGITVSGKPLKDALRTYGHGQAYDYMYDLMSVKTLTIENIMHIHRLLMEKEQVEIAGKYKTVENFISGSSYTTVACDDLEEEMKRLSTWMEENENRMNPIEYAAELHRKLVYIHPFEDGNGRTARLAMNTKLIQNGYLPCVIAPVHRLDYNNALEAGRRGERNQFIELIAEIELETQRILCDICIWKCRILQAEKHTGKV
ncbi:MAG: Fic family protein [Bacteroidales bacterium]|nr:Fic family protein [Clostridium sp.]MCM1203966.1 Fic family protein [Bacteroidales bacterium]